MLFLDETDSPQYQKLESPDHWLELRATNDKKKSHWDHFSEDTGVLAQLSGSTCPQMSSLSAFHSCFAFVALLLWVSNQHLGFYIDLLVDCEMKIKMRRKASSEGRLSFSYHIFVRSSRVYPGLLHTQHPAGRIVPVWARGKIKYGLPWWQWWLRDISVTNLVH